MKLLYTTVLICFLGMELYGQNYTRDAGLCFGNGLLVTYRQFYKENMAFEMFGGYQDRGMRLGGLREFYKPALTKYSGNFRFFYGYGVHTGFNYTNQYKMFNRVYRYDWKFTPLFGMDGIVGIDYAFSEVPIIVAADIKPFYEFSLNRIFHIQLDASFSVKYRF
jgi:hypothetical protein